MSYMPLVNIENYLGDLTDPHGTHRKCLEIIMHLIEEDKKLKEGEKKKLFPEPENIFLYRGAW
jgi:hypothetical protein